MIPGVITSQYKLSSGGLNFSTCILVSENLYNQIYENNNHLYNIVIAYGNDSLSYDSTDKIMSSITTNQTIHFLNERLYKETQWQQIIDDTNEDDLQNVQIICSDGTLNQ